MFRPPCVMSSHILLRSEAMQHAARGKSFSGSLSVAHGIRARCQRIAQRAAEPQVANNTVSSLREPLDTIKASVEDPQASTQPSDDDLSIHVYRPSVFTYCRKSSSALEGVWIIASDVILPLIVVCFGALCSAVSLYVTLKPAE